MPLKATAFPTGSLRTMASNETFYGLPMYVKELLKSLRGIDHLYPWQDELLVFMANLHEKALLLAAQGGFGCELSTNLLYMSPTGGGKTLIALILSLQCMLLSKLNCIFTVPFVSIVDEIVRV